MVFLKCKDDKIVSFPEKYIPQSFLLLNIFSCTKIIEPISIELFSETLEILLKFMSHNNQIIKKNYEVLEIRMNPEIIYLLESLSNEQLGSLTNAANYMDSPVILEFTCKFIAEKVQDKSLDELKEIFGTKDDRYSNDSKKDLNDKFDWMTSSEDHQSDI